VTARGRRRVQDLEDEVDRRRSPKLQAWAPLADPEAHAELARNYLTAVANAGDSLEAREAGEAFLEALAELDTRQDPPRDR